MKNTTSPVELHLKVNIPFLAGFLGWTFDAFDFFILTYLLAQLSKDLHRAIADIALLLTASLVMRPFGAMFFGFLGDRYGRRRPLMFNILFNSCIDVLSGLVPTYGILFFLRILFGIGMGGVWGLGASLAMESVPPGQRGTFSGILQEGYAIGNLLAAVAFWTIFPRWGWRPMFFLSTVPALLTLFLLSKLDESPIWKAAAIPREGWADYFRLISANKKRLLYLTLLMSMMGLLSHGTQDLYPTFLLQQKDFLPSATAIIIVMSMIGAIIGGALGGILSDRLGRRRTMIVAELCSLLIIPLWLLPDGIPLVALGAFMMQFMVQAAWGVIPAHINELVPDRVRALLPGLSYQIGILVASVAPYVEVITSRHFNFVRAMGIAVAVVVIAGVLVIAAGPEARNVTFGKDLDEKA